jgi:hypothetical protein
VPALVTMNAVSEQGRGPGRELADGEERTADGANAQETTDLERGIEDS